MATATVGIIKELERIRRDLASVRTAMRFTRSTGSMVMGRDLLSAVGGTFMVSKAAASLYYAMTVPASGTWSMTLYDPPSGNYYFANSDICRVTALVADGDDYDTKETWYVVSARAAGSDNTQTYTCTYSSGDRGWTYPQGVAVVDYGASGQGLLLMTATGTGSPRYALYTHAGAPWSAMTTRGVYGNLNGDFGISSDLYGFAVGNYAGGDYLKYDTSAGFAISAGGGGVMLNTSGILLARSGVAGAKISFRASLPNGTEEASITSSGTSFLISGSDETVIVGGNLRFDLNASTSDEYTFGLIDNTKWAGISANGFLLHSAINTKGTTFPASPSAGQVYYRTDLHLECTYNGTFWHALNPHWVIPDELPDIISVWPFGMRATGKVYDAGRRVRDLTENGTVTYTNLGVRGTYGSGWSTANYLSSTSVNFGNFTTATAMIWYHITGSLGTEQCLMSNDSSGTRGWRLDHKVSAGLTFVGSAGQLDASGMNDAQDVWYLGGFTYSSTSVKIFRFTTHAMASTTGTAAIGTLDNSFMVGRDNYTGFEYPFVGRLAAPKFFGAALSDLAIEYIVLCEIALLKE